jgi:sirohydrochlorin cobaltochelatase
MANLIVLAVHGAPPNDFPPAEMAEFSALHARIEHGDPSAVPEPLRRRAAQLEARLRDWPRHAGNDPFWAASHELGAHLGSLTGCDVLVGFNEFCAPGLDEVLEMAAARGARVTVVTPMLTRGGSHAEQDIPTAIGRARAAHPDVSFAYAWPYDMAEVARFLAARVAACDGRQDRTEAPGT